MMSFDGETLQRYATIRSKESVSIIEKHTEALFGRPDAVITPEGKINSSKDEIIKISFGGLKRLVLEAVTFGSFLWDVESYVDSRYHFVLN
nr:unknown [Lotus japonicus]